MLTNDRPFTNSDRPRLDDDDFYEVPQDDVNSSAIVVANAPHAEDAELLDEPVVLETEAILPNAIFQKKKGRLKSGGSKFNSNLIIDPQTLTNTWGGLRNLGFVLLASLPVLLVAAVLRLINFGQASAYMDEGIYIVTGRTLIEHNVIYENALQWTFGSLLYPVVSGWFDIRGGLNASRLFSVFWGLAMVQATIFTTLGLFKAYPTSKEQEVGDFSVSSKPVVAGLLAGLVVAILPTVNALSRFATYDAMAAGLFACGCAAFVWAWRENTVARQVGDKRNFLIVSLLVASAALFFGAFLTKYVIAAYFPFLCLLLLANNRLRLKGLLGFVVPLSLACAGYYLLFSDQLSLLLKFAHQYEDLRSDDFLNIYVLQRFEVLALLVLGYWGFRQAFRDGRIQAPLLLWGGALVMIVFQLVTRADYDYWKHSVYIILMMAPLVGWLFSDWSWWDEPTGTVHQSGRLARTWISIKTSGIFGQSGTALEPLERRVSGNSLTERAKSASLALVLAAVLVLGGVVWSLTEVPRLLGHWPQLTDKSVENIRRFGLKDGPVLVDDTAVNYYLYNEIPTNYIFNPFSFTYGNLSGLPAYTQAVNDHKFNLIILDGGATANGTRLTETLQPILKASPAYMVVYSEPLLSPNLDGNHTLEIYRLLTVEEQAEGLKSQSVQAAPTAPGATTATPAAASAPAMTTPVATNSSAAGTATVGATPTAFAPKATPTVAPPAFPASPTFNFDNGDEGWGILPNAGPLEAGSGVSANADYKLANHNSLRFTPQPENKLYTVGANHTGEFQKITMLVFVPATKADYNVRVGMYYFDKKWTWIDDGFQGEAVPGQWTKLTWELPAKASMQQFGLKLAGYSGSIYITGVTVE